MSEPRSKQFENIFYGLSNTPGILKLAPSGIGWKTSDSENIVTISAEEFKKMQWMRVARNYQLRIALKNGNAARFDGFNKDVCTIFFIILYSLTLYLNYFFFYVDV